MAGGVIYARNLEDYKKDFYQASINKQNNKSFWIEPPVPKGAMLVLILPQGYIIPTTEEANPTFLEAKIFKNRMALIWIERSEQDIEFSWHMKKGQNMADKDLREFCSRLNEGSSAKRKNEKKVAATNTISIKKRNPASIPIAIVLGVLAPISGIFGNLAASASTSIPHFLSPLLEFAWVIFLILMGLWVILAIWQPFAN
ncbi:MAG TPA: hypothetical protein VF043_05930 [Ktedonobacteraceae bacterium]